jgi:hypothetical protein
MELNIGIADIAEGVTAGTKQWNEAQRSMIPMSYRIQAKGKRSEVWQLISRYSQDH